MPAPSEHEFGHNVGLQHANNPRAEYGGLYEVMGSGPSRLHQPDARHRLPAGSRASSRPARTSTAAPAARWALALARGRPAGLRSVVFIDPDNGKRLLRRLPRRRRRRRAAPATPPGLQLRRRPTASPTARRGHRAGERGPRRVPARRSRAATARSRPARRGPTQSGSVDRPRDHGQHRAGHPRRHAGPRRPASASIAGARRPFATVSAPAPVAGATALRYQWLVNGQPIPQADDPTFTPVARPWPAARSSVTAHRLRRGPRPEPADLDRADGGARRPGTPTGTAATPRSPAARGSAQVLTRRRASTGSTDYGSQARRSTRRPTSGPATASSSRAPPATYRLDREATWKRIQVSEYPRAAGFETTSYVRSDATRQGPDRQAHVAAPDDRRQGQGRQAGHGPDEGLDPRDEVPLPVVRRQEGDPRRTGKKLRISRSLKGKKIAVKVTGHQEGLQEGQREVAGHEGEVTQR